MKYKLLKILTDDESFDERITKELNDHAKDGWRVVHSYTLAIGVYLLEKKDAEPLTVVEMSDNGYGTRIPVKL